MQLARPYVKPLAVAYADSLDAGIGSGEVVPYDGVLITTQPVDWLGLETETATFTVVATSGNGSGLSYQWQEYNGTSWDNLSDGGNVSGTQTATLTITNVQVADHLRTFRVAVTNSFNTVTSGPARIILTGATWFILDEAGNRTITEILLNEIVDERSI